MSGSAAPTRPIRPDEPIAVTICTKNRPAYLAALLATLVNQSYPHWMLVLNDQSESPVTAQDSIKDVLQLLRTRGHQVLDFRSSEPRTRYQQALEAVPSGIEFVTRVDDDVLLTPRFLEQILQPYALLPQLRLAAVGPCLPEPHMRPLPLESRLADPAWRPRIDRPTWRLQGHAYDASEILEVESLWGSAMCYRRSAAMEVGGWTVVGQSEQIFREDSDMSARLLAAGYRLVVSTAALGWHLAAPSGGSREYRKSPSGNVLVTDPRAWQEDDRLFQERVAALLASGSPPRATQRYRIADLEAGRIAARPLVSRRGQVLRLGGKMVYRALNPLRDAVRFVRDGT